MDLTVPKERRRREPVFNRILIIGISISLWACSSASNDNEETLPPNPSTPETGLCASEEASFDIQGQWAVRMELEVQGSERPEAWVTLCPENPQVGTAIAWMKLEYSTALSQGATSHTATICALELPIVTAGLDNCPSSPAEYLEVRMNLADAFRNYLPTVALSGTTHTGSTTPQSAFRTDSIEFVGGVEGADDDGDGHTGVTLDFNTGGTTPAIAGSVYASFELSTQLQGQVRNPRCIEGSTAATLNYTVTNSDIKLWGEEPLSTEEAVTNIPLLQVLESSTFRALRANGQDEHDFDDDADGNISCTEIIAHASVFKR